MLKKTLTLAGLSVLSLSVYSDVPHTFTDGKMAIAAEVNENFTSLDNRVNAIDLEPPKILVDVPESTPDGEALVTVTFTDNQGLFKYNFGNSSNGTVAYESEQSIVREQLYRAPFGRDLNVKIFAHATDLSGNSATAAETFTIKSSTAVTAGTYILDEPLDEVVSGSGCQLEYYESPRLQANNIYVSGSFIDPNDSYNNCNNMGYENADENAVACINVSVQNLAYVPLSGSINETIMSLEDTVFSFDSQNGSGFSPDDNYQSYTQMDVEFYATVPATVEITMTLRCESSQYGTTSFGPYQLRGTLQ